MGLSQRFFRQVKQYQVSGKQLFWELKFILHLPVAAGSLGFAVTVDPRPLVLRLRGTGERAGQVKTPQNSLFLQGSTIFLKKKKNAPQVVKPLFNFQSSETPDFDNFCQCSYCFYGKTCFQRSLLHHSRRASSCSEFSSHFLQGSLGSQKEVGPAETMEPKRFQRLQVSSLPFLGPGVIKPQDEPSVSPRPWFWRWGV